VLVPSTLNLDLYTDLHNVIYYCLRFLNYDFSSIARVMQKEHETTGVCKESSVREVMFTN